MKSKIFALIFLFAIVLVFGMMGVSGSLTTASDKNVNISLIIQNGNGSLYSFSNATTLLLNFTIKNGTTLAGSNWSYVLDGTSYVFCNTSAGATQPAIRYPQINVSGCAGDLVNNSLYLNLSEGLHSIMINVTFGAQLNSTSLNTTGASFGGSNSSFYVNNFDSLAWVAGVHRSGNNVSNTGITANVTMNTVVGNVTFWLWNTTSVTTYNATSNIFNYTVIALSTSNFSGNYTWTGLPVKHYTYNVTLTDIYTGDNKSLTRQIILDTVAPNSTISCTGWKSSTDKTVEKSTTFTCTCTGVDENSTAIFYTYDPSSTPTTATTGLKGVSCYTRDLAGNNGTSSGILTYTVIDATTTDGGAGGGPGAAAGITGTTYVVTSEQFSTGHSAALKANDGFKITFKPSAAEAPQTHTIRVSEVTANSATIVISSDPITIKLDTGEEKKVDIDTDGTYDVYLKLNSVADNKADMTVKQVSEVIPEGEGPVSGGTGLEEEAEAGEEEAKGISNLTWIIIAIIVVVVIVIIIAAVKKKK